MSPTASGPGIPMAWTRSPTWRWSGRGCSTPSVTVARWFGSASAEEPGGYRARQHPRDHRAVPVRARLRRPDGQAGRDPPARRVGRAHPARRDDPARRRGSTTRTGGSRPAAFAAGSCSPSETSSLDTSDRDSSCPTFRRQGHPGHRRHLRHGPGRRRAGRRRGREGRPGGTWQGGRRRAGRRAARRRARRDLRADRRDGGGRGGGAGPAGGRARTAGSTARSTTSARPPRIGPVTEIDDDAWHAELALNLSSVFFGLKHQIPALQASGGGAIVNNASILGVTGSGRHGLLQRRQARRRRAHPLGGTRHGRDRHTDQRA